MSSSTVLAVVLLFATAIFPSCCDPHDGEHLHHANKKWLLHAEKLGELYYQNQLKERNGSLTYTAFIHLNPNYPCVHGVIPLGEDTPSSAVDGHKFSCGIMHIKSAPIVYSFGSNRQQDFETAVLNLRPDARIWTHDLLESNLPLPKDRLSTINYTATALGLSSQNSGDKKFKLLHEYMKERGHTYIDILKVDIEYGEFSWVANEPLDIFTRIGQLMIEVHRPGGGKCVRYFNLMHCN
jgi:Methyltransferase domain